MATCASKPGEILCVDRGVRIETRLDGVDAVAIGADRGERVALGDGLSVDALQEFGFHRLMALATGGGNVELEDGGLVIAGAANFVGAVAIGADGGLGGSGSHGAPVYALLIRIELLRALALALHHDFLRVTDSAGGWNVGMINGRFGIVGRQDLVRAAMAGDASWGLQVSGAT